VSAGLTRLIRSLALMRLIKNLGRHNNHRVWCAYLQLVVVYISSRYGERDIHSCHARINVLSLHYRRSTIHIPDNVSEPYDIVENLQKLYM
jgi:hypothetical protein